jgi:hypothetical protein
MKEDPFLNLRFGAARRVVAPQTRDKLATGYVVWSNFFPVTYRTFLASNPVTDSLARPLAFSRPRSEIEAESWYCLLKLLPVILNSKEEIGWKVQLQNSNLRQEIV